MRPFWSPRRTPTVVATTVATTVALAVVNWLSEVFQMELALATVVDFLVVVDSLPPMAEMEVEV